MSYSRSRQTVTNCTQSMEWQRLQDFRESGEEENARKAPVNRQP